MSKLTGAEVSSYAGGAVSIGASLTLTQIGILVGIGTALLTFAANLFFAYRKDQRERQLAEAERLLAEAERLLAEAELAKLPGQA